MTSSLHERAAARIRPEAPTQLSTAKLAPIRRNLERRVARLEQSSRLLGIGFLGGIALAAVFAFMLANRPQPVSGEEPNAAAVTSIAGKEIKLVDSAGRPRFVVRMYSDVPVMQLIDAHGQSRLVFGLKLDDAPFVDLSDGSGNTRASLSLGDDNAAVLRVFDEHGNASLAIN